MARIRNLGNLEIHRGYYEDYTDFSIELDQPEPWMSQVDVHAQNSCLQLEPDGLWKNHGDETGKGPWAKDAILMRQNFIAAPIGKFVYRLARDLNSGFMVGVYHDRRKTFLGLSALNLSKVEKPSLYVEALSRKMSAIWQEICAGRTPATPQPNPTNRITLTPLPQDRSQRFDVLITQFSNARLSPLQATIVERAASQLKSEGLKYIESVTQSEDLRIESHSLAFSYRTSLVERDCWDRHSDTLTPLGKYLDGTDGWVYDQEDKTIDGESLLVTVLKQSYWNPEWPNLLRVRLGWDYTRRPGDQVGLRVVCSVDTDDHLIHLVLNSHFREAMEGIGSILEQFLTRRVEMVLKPDPLAT